MAMCGRLSQHPSFKAHGVPIWNANWRGALFLVQNSQSYLDENIETMYAVA